MCEVFVISENGKALFILPCSNNFPLQIVRLQIAGRGGGEENSFRFFLTMGFLSDFFDSECSLQVINVNSLRGRSTRYRPKCRNVFGCLPVSLTCHRNHSCSTNTLHFQLKNFHFLSSESSFSIEESSSFVYKLTSAMNTTRFEPGSGFHLFVTKASF